jgi:hypothetical protein
MCGLVFLTRNDAAFLIFGILSVRFLHGWLGGRASFREALSETVPVGLISILVASPWLIYNYSLFGSIVPISGHAQSLRADFAENAPLAPIKVFETMFPMLPVPGALETLSLSMALGLLAAAVLVTFLWIGTRRGNAFSPVILAYTVWAALIVGYYSLFFGAGHFLSRYFAPLAPLMITAAIAVALQAAARLAPGRARALASGAGAAGTALAMLLMLRLLIPGVHQQGHFQVVDWVRANVPENAWVGAVQTGTLGYWHDRTINLDGKVNPHALRARMEKGHVLDYVAEDTEIEYIADWPGIAGWVKMPEGSGAFGRQFEVIVLDADGRLAVLRRRDPAQTG